MHPPGFTHNAGNPDRGERAAGSNNGRALVFRWSPLHVGRQGDLPRHICNYPTSAVLIIIA
jgi:hypothetical protein